MGLLESRHPARRSVEEDPMARFGGLDSDPNGEVCFPGSGWSEEDDILRFGEEHACAQVRDQVPVGRGLMVEVEVLEGLATREPGGLDSERCPGSLAFRDLLGKHRGEDGKGRQRCRTVSVGHPAVERRRDRGHRGAGRGA